MGKVTGMYRGLSLKYFRMLLNKDMNFAPSVKRYCDLYPQRLGKDLYVGKLVLFPDASPVGDCGAYLGDDMVLMLDSSGKPKVKPMPNDSVYWTL